MSYFRKGDPLDDFDRLDRQQAAHEAHLPCCDICGCPILDDHYYEIRCEDICHGCLDDLFRKEIEI